jgi:spermidine synthase
MKPWVTLETSTTPDGAPLLLQKRDDEWVIRTGGHLLMSSRTHGSEVALAHAALEGKKGITRLLVGGLGMGFTLRAALDKLGREATVIVAELIPAVVTWNRGPLSKLAGRPLDDVRVQIHAGDVRDILKAEQNAFDAVLLDVDNGPSALVQEGNVSLYSQKGLGLIHRALKPGGRLSLWSAQPVPLFLGKLRDAGFEAEMRPAGSRHVIFLGTR